MDNKKKIELILRNEFWENNPIGIIKEICQDMAVEYNKNEALIAFLLKGEGE